MCRRNVLLRLPVYLLRFRVSDDARNATQESRSSLRLDSCRPRRHVNPIKDIGENHSLGKDTQRIFFNLKDWIVI